MCLSFYHEAFVHALNNSERRLYPRGSEFGASGGSFFSSSLKAEQLLTADLEAWKVEHEAHKVKIIGLDPFVNCPACAKSTRGTLNDGESRVFAVCN